jgi:CBS domain-containing protein
MTIAAILKHKSQGSADVASVSPTDPIAEVARVLAARRIGAVLVRDTARQVLGILSERDIIRFLASHGPGALELTAAQVMTTNIQTATPATTVTEAMSMMTAGRFRHLPVLAGDELVGIVSIGDVVNARLRDQENEVDNLRAYVAG